MAITDQILLKRFAKGDEKAFRIFVERHFGLVFQVALRRTRQRQLAEEVTQNVFCAVAKKASPLSNKSDLLLPWLHRATLFESSKAMRSEQSSQRRKQLNHPDNIPATTDQENTAWLLALPYLDEALDRLSASDRKVVLQHYFEGQSFPAIAKQEGRPAGTLQKQCRRALEKLARILRGRGATISSVTLAGCLTPQLTEAAASTHLVSTIATQAISGASLHATTGLSVFMLTKSKAILPLTLITVLLPLAAQQITISREASKNRALKSSFATTTPTKASSRSRAVSSTRNWVSTGDISLEALQSAQSEARRLGTLKEIEFEKLIASLSKEDLVRLIPQALDLSNRDKRIGLSQLLINALATIDPEATVHLISEHYPNNPCQLNLGVERALSLWTEQNPEAAVNWLQAQGQILNETSSNRSGWRDFHGFQAAALTQLIESHSPLVRDVFSLNPAYPKHYLIRDAAALPSPAGWHNDTEPQATLTEQAERVEAFLPWIREFGTSKPPRRSGGNRGELLESVISEASPRWDNDSLPDLAAELITRKKLEPTETTTVIRQTLQHILNKYFIYNRSSSWEKHQNQAFNWAKTHAPRQSETLLIEAQEIVLKGERFQVKNRIEAIENGEKVSFTDDFLRIDFQLFPDFLERARQQVARITDPEERAKAEAYLSQ